jgi:hypothetical protein
MILDLICAMNLSIVQTNAACDKPSSTGINSVHYLRISSKHLSPESFERLVQRMLREAGFTQVEVTGRTGDGGIDGKGIARIHGLMSFHVLFQCKRYTGSVGAGEIRDFRGAMVGALIKAFLLQRELLRLRLSKRQRAMARLRLI